MGTTDKKNPIASMIVKRTMCEVDGAEWIYRIRSLTPSEAVRLQIGLTMLASAARRDDGEALEMSDDQTVAMTEQMCDLACAVVMSAKKPRGRQWYDLRLVPTIDLQDPDRGLVCIGGIPSEDVLAIVTAATTTYRRAAKMAAPFPK